MSARRGTGLAELLLSLALGGVIASAATRGLVQHLRLQRAREATARAEAIVRDVHEVLRAELAHAAADVQVVGDTALQVSSVRVFTRACQLDASRLVIPAAESWWSAARAGDSVAIMDTLMRAEWRGAIAAVGTVRTAPACPTGGTRITLAVPMPPTVPANTVPMRIWRAARYASYRAGDGTWWLGERSCTPVCGAAQPIAGPLLAPAAQGFRVLAVRDGAGVTRAVDLVVRAVVDGREVRRTARLAVESP
jgi:type II secretory pathway component PulJ